jgi:hypothetical protein
MAQSTTNNGNGGTAVVAILSVLILGVAGYFVWKGIKTSQGNQNNNDKEPKQPQQPQNTEGQNTPQGALDGKPKFTLLESIFNSFKSGSISATKSDISGFTFPIKKGQRNGNVKKLQLLLLQYNKNLLPKYGADGDFGTETENALFSILGKKVVESNDDINMIKSKGIERGLNVVFNPLSSLGLK